MLFGFYAFYAFVPVLNALNLPQRRAEPLGGLSDWLVRYFGCEVSAGHYVTVMFLTNLDDYNLPTPLVLVATLKLSYRDLSQRVQSPCQQLL